MVILQGKSRAGNEDRTRDIVLGKHRIPRNYYALSLIAGGFKAISAALGGFRQDQRRDQPAQQDQHVLAVVPLPFILLLAACGGVDHISVTLPEGRSDLVAVVQEINTRVGCDAVRVGEGIKVEMVDHCDYEPDCFGAYLSDNTILILDGDKSLARLALIHEIGHAFGLEHTEASCQIMSATQPRDFAEITDEQWSVYVASLRDAGACQTAR
jgi:hypothetical protein